MPDGPYIVTKQHHERTYRKDGQMGGQWTVDIEHRNGTKSSFVLPEEAYNPATVHETAMQHVQTAEAVAGLPATAPRSK